MTNLNPGDMEGSDLKETLHSSDDPTNALTDDIHNSASVPVSTPSDPFNERLALAIKLHVDGVAGNPTAVQDAHQILEQLRAEYPDNPLVDAYYGSTMILIARDKKKALDKLKWSNNGLKILDNAVAADPHDSTIRMLRGKSSYNLPEKYFHRTKTAIEDFTFLLNTQTDTPDTDEQLQLIYELGEAYARIGRNQDAASQFRRLESLAQNSAWQQLSQQKLQALEGKPALEDIPNESPISMLVEATRSVGSALLAWADDGKKEELAQQEERAKKRALKEAKKEAKKRVKEKVKELVKEIALEKEREKEKEKEKERERETTLEIERQMELEELRKMSSLKKSKEKYKPKAKQIKKRKGKPLAKPRSKPSKPKAKAVVKPKATVKPKNRAFGITNRTKNGSPSKPLLMLVGRR